MSAKGLSYGLNITKKPGVSRPQPAKRKTIFDEEDDSDGENAEKGTGVEEIGEIGGLSSKQAPPKSSQSATAPQVKGNPPKLNAGGSKKTPITMYGDLSSAFTSKQHSETAEQLDENIYDYDGVYDSIKPQKKKEVEGQDRKTKYMDSLVPAAAVRKRDATIAEEKKYAREREAEGEEFA